MGLPQPPNDSRLSCPASHCRRQRRWVWMFQPPFPKRTRWRGQLEPTVRFPPTHQQDNPSSIQGRLKGLGQKKAGHTRVPMNICSHAIGVAIGKGIAFEHTFQIEPPKLGLQEERIQKRSSLVWESNAELPEIKDRAKGSPSSLRRRRIHPLQTSIRDQSQKARRKANMLLPSVK